MNSDILEYYLRCRHGIKLLRCDICKIGVDVIPEPIDWPSYTYQECVLYHEAECKCDGCGVYGITKLKLNELTKKLDEPEQLELGL